jgi:hypothetical protein
MEESRNGEGEIKREKESRNWRGRAEEAKKRKETRER